MNTKTIVAAAAILVVLGAGYALAGPAQGGFWNMMGGYGSGMMAGYGSSFMGAGGMMGNVGSGMMSGYGNGMMNSGGMMGSYGNGMMNNGGMMAGTGNENQCGAYAADNGANSNPITIDEAKKSVEQYLTTTGNNDLELAEVLQFDNHFYAGIKEKSTGKYAFEVIVNKYTGAVGPEMGPNMMWNTKYGHMNIGETETTVTKEQAVKNAQDYLDISLPETKVTDADTFYGYYTMEVTKDGQIYGMLSVNSNTGSVWYHRWHGTFVKMLEVE